MIKNIKIFFLLESILKGDKNFIEILKSLQNSDTVARYFLSLFERDIKTNLNYIKASPTSNDEIFFLNDSQAKRVEGDPFDKSINVSKIGRSVRQILDANGLKISDKEVEIFVNAYKYAWENKFKKHHNISMVSGEDIRKWYNEKMYIAGGGTLNNSCMKSVNCQGFFDIYVENPGTCQMVIYQDDGGKLLARAIVWKLDPSENNARCEYFLDRIYTRFDYDEQRVKDWFKTNFKCESYYSYYDNANFKLTVSLEKWKFPKYPYMDTFSTIDIGTSKIMMDLYRNKSVPQINARTTNGEIFVPGYVYSVPTDKWVDENRAIKIDGQIYDKSDAVLDYRGIHILKSSSTWSDKYQSYIKSEDVVEDEELGVVSKLDIITVYDKLTGDIPESPKKYLASVNTKERKYIRIRVSGSYFYVNRENLIYNVSDDTWQSSEINESQMKLYLIDAKTIDPSNSSVMSKIDGYGKMSFRVGSLISEIPIFMYIVIPNSKSGGYFFSQKTLESMGIDFTNSKFIIISIAAYYGKFEHQIKDLSIQELKKIQFHNPEKKIEEIEEAHRRLMDKNNKYTLRNKKYEFKLKGIGIDDYMNQIISEAFQKEDLLKEIQSKKTINSIIVFIKNYKLPIPKNSKNDLIDNKNANAENIEKYINDYLYYIVMYIYYWIIIGNKEIGVLSPFLNFDLAQFISRFKHTELSSTIYAKVRSIESEIPTVDRELFRSYFNDLGLKIEDYRYGPLTGYPHPSITTQSNILKPPFDKFYQIINPQTPISSTI